MILYYRYNYIKHISTLKRTLYRPIQLKDKTLRNPHIKVVTIPGEQGSRLKVYAMSMIHIVW